MDDRKVRAKERDFTHRLTATELERERLKLREKFGNLYEDYSEGILEQSEYEFLKKDYCDKLSQLEEHIRIEKNMAENDAEWLSEKLDSFRSGKALTRPMVQAFLDNVVVYGRDRVEVELNDTDAVFQALKGE